MKIIKENSVDKKKLYIKTLGDLHMMQLGIITVLYYYEKYQVMASLRKIFIKRLNFMFLKMNALQSINRQDWLFQVEGKWI